MGEKREPKISVVEIILIGFFLLILDVVSLIPFLGDLTDVAAAPLFFYYKFKHINGVAYVVGWILSLIPFVQEFFPRTIAWIITVLMDRFAPAKLEQAIEKVGELEEGAEGGGAGAEGEAAGAGASTAAGAEGGAASGAGGGNAEGGGSAGETGGKAGGGTAEGQETASTGKTGGGARGGESPKGDDFDSKEDEGDDMRQGAEITPEEEAQEAAFGSQEESSGEDQDDEEGDDGKEDDGNDDEPGAVMDHRTQNPAKNPNSGSASKRNNVVDLRTRKPIQTRQQQPEDADDQSEDVIDDQPRKKAA